MATSARRSTQKGTKPGRTQEKSATPDPPRKRKGRPPKLGDHQLFSLRLPTDLHRALKTYAFVSGKSFNDVLVEVLKDWWARQPEHDHIEALVRMRRDAPDDDYQEKLDE